MPTHTRTPLPVEAWLYVKKSSPQEPDCPQWVKDAFELGKNAWPQPGGIKDTYPDDFPGIQVSTYGAIRIVQPGDWVVRNGDGSLEAHNVYSFREQYEPIPALGATDAR